MYADVLVLLNPSSGYSLGVASCLRLSLHHELHNLHPSTCFLFNPRVVFLLAASPMTIPMKAANLTASFEVRGANVTAVFSWDLWRTAPNQPLMGYQVTWVEIIPTNHHNNKLHHSLISQSQILPPVSKLVV